MSSARCKGIKQLANVVSDVHNNVLETSWTDDYAIPSPYLDVGLIQPHGVFMPVIPPSATRTIVFTPTVLQAQNNVFTGQIGVPITDTISLPIVQPYPMTSFDNGQIGV